MCYYNLGRYLKTSVYLDWFNLFRNFPLRSQFRSKTPEGIPHYNYEYFFTKLDRNEFVETLRERDFSVSSMDWAGVPLLTYILPEQADVYQIISETLVLFFNECCALDTSHISAVRKSCAKGQLIGVHARYGDSIIAGESWRLYEAGITDFYLLLKEQLEEESTIFLVSDCKNHDLVEYVKNILGTKHNYLSYISQPKHSGHTVYNKSDWDELMFDIMLLSQCEKIYASPNSNVSRIAMCLAHARNPLVPMFFICPFSKTVEKVEKLPLKRYNAWKFDGLW